MNIDCGEGLRRYYLIDDDEFTVPCRLTKDPKPFGMRVYMAEGRSPLVVVRELPHSPAPPSWHIDKLAAMAFRVSGFSTNFKMFISERKGSRLTVSRVKVWFAGKFPRPMVSCTQVDPSSWGEVNRIILGEAE